MKKRILSLLLVLVMIVGLLPTVARAEGETQPQLIKSFELRVNQTLIDTSRGTGGFSEDKLVYDFETVSSSSNEYNWKISAQAVSSTAKITAVVGDGEPFEVQRNLKAIEGLVYGDNVLKMTVADGDASTTYTFNIRILPRAGMGNCTDALGTYYYYYSADVKDNEHQLYNTAGTVQDDYYLFVPRSISELTLSSFQTGEGYNSSINGTVYTDKNNIKLSLTGLNELKVHTETLDKKYSNDYTVHIHWLDVFEQSFEVPEGALVRLWNRVHLYQKQKEGDPLTYTGLVEGETYSYAVVKDGYISVDGSFTAAAGNETIKIASMEKNPENPHTQYDGEWTNFRGSDDNMAIRSAKTPTTGTEVGMKWAVKMGTDMWQSPTPPIILNDVEVDGVKHDVLICAMYKKIYLLDKETGEVLKSAQMKGSAGFATNPLTYAEGMVFVQLDNQIQAFDAVTLESVWLSEKIGGQTISPITYYKGHIYIGTWQGESTNGTFACFSVDDEKPDQTDEIKYAKWTLTHKGGFYWAGAYVTDNYVVFGSDDGTSEGDYTANAVFYSVNPETGAVIDKIDGIKGDIRSTVAYYEGACYAVTKGGLFLKAPISADGHFDHDKFQTVDMGNMCTSTPIIYKGKAFIGTSGAKQFGSPGTLNVIDVNTMQIVKNITLPGYPQAPMLMSTGYEEETGMVYIYTTYNAPPGGLYCVTWDVKADTYEVEHIFIPASDQQQYCLGSPICDNEGTIYYKNDSGYLFALSMAETYAEDIQINGTSISSFAPSVDSYSFIRSEHSVTVSATGPEGTTVEIVVNGKSYQNSAEVALTGTFQDVLVVIHKGEASRTYTLSLRTKSDNINLTNVFVGPYVDSEKGKYVMTPEFSNDTTEYMVYDIPEEQAWFIVHAYGEDALSSLHFRYLTPGSGYGKDQIGYGKGNVNDDTHWWNTNMLRFKNQDTVSVKITLASESGKATRDLYVTGTHLSKEAYENQGKLYAFALKDTYADIDHEAKTVSLDLTIPVNEMNQWDITALTPDLTFGGTSISPARGEAVDFTNPVTYTVTAADGSATDYTVTVRLTAGPSSNTALKSVTVCGVPAVKQEGTMFLYSNECEYYKVVLPYGSEIPADEAQLQAETDDPDATVSFRYYEAFGLWSVTVKAPNKTSKQYLVQCLIAGPSYTVTFDPNGGTCEPASAETNWETGMIAELPVPVRVGYLFQGWFTDAVAGDRVTLSTIYEADTTIYAHWKSEDLDAAEKVIAKIDAIGDVTLRSGDVIKAARDAYDALTRAQKELVSNYDALVAAEKEYARLVAAVKAAATDEEADASRIFQDVSSRDWFCDAVSYVYAKGIMNGTSKTEFSPYAELTRGMIVTILYRMEGEPFARGTKTFADVASGRYYSAAVEWAAENDIVNGFTDGTFKPEQAVTREQLAAILSRYARFSGAEVYEAELPENASVSNWAKKDAAWAYAEGILDGAQIAAAAQNANRAEVAAAIYTYLTKTAR